MEDKKLTEKESLELIAEMIQSTKENMEEGSGNLFLLWGYLSTIVALGIYFVWITTGISAVFWAWWLIPAIGFPASVFLKKRYPQPVKTDIDRIISQVWLVGGLGCILTPVASMFVRMPILFIEALIVTMFATATGVIVRYKPIYLPGIAGIFLSFALLFVSLDLQILIFASLFVLLMVVPGHILNAACARRKRKE